jgi:hypothetical protein
MCLTVRNFGSENYINSNLGKETEEQIIHGKQDIGNVWALRLQKA